MFLTTNRANTIDRAFKSRVDLILAYSNLSYEARRNIWVNFIGKLPKEDIDLQDSEISELAQSRLNGREIKSWVKTAWILAAKNKPLRMRHFNIVLDNRRRTERMDLEYGEDLADDEHSDTGKLTEGRERKRRKI
jgi:AAA+ superfamily predicted ATPase